MNVKPLFVAGAVLLIGTTAQAQQAAPYSPPPKGTAIETSAGLLTVDAVQGYDLRLQDSQGGFRNPYALLVPKRGGDTGFSRRAVESMWPLQVGKSETIHYTTSAGGHEMTWKVPRMERITVPAGTFDTYVIELWERSVDYQYQAKETMWYSPALGYFVKFKQDLIAGTVAKEPWELVSFRNPSGAIIAGAGLAPTTTVIVPSTTAVVPGRVDSVDARAAFCRERGTTLRLADGRVVTVDCATYVQTEQLAYQDWLRR